jgi:hypothetical protein
MSINNGPKGFTILFVYVVFHTRNRKKIDKELTCSSPLGIGWAWYMVYLVHGITHVHKVMYHEIIYEFW